MTYSYKLGHSYNASSFKDGAVTISYNPPLVLWAVIGYSSAIDFRKFRNMFVLIVAFLML